MISFIMLPKSVFESRVFANAELFKVYCWCLNKARYMDNSAWFKVQTGKGFTEVEINKGQFIYGRNAASEELQMPPSTVQSLISKLSSMRYISVESKTHYSVVSVRYDIDYQQVTQQLEQPNNNQLTTNTQPKTHKYIDIESNKVYKEEIKESGEIFQISPTPTQEKIEVEKIEKPKPKRKKMQTTNEPKDYTEVLKNATQDFLDLDDELIELWNILNNEKTWKSKSDHARHLQAVSLVDFTPEFIKHRLKITIVGGKEGAYPSIIYKNTPQDFEYFLKNPKKQIQTRREGLSREIWDNLIAMPMYDTNTDYEKALKYYEAVKNNLPKTVKLQMFDEKELCTLFAAMTEEVKAKKIKEAYRTIIANPEKYNHYGLLFEAIKEIIFK